MCCFSTSEPFSKKWNGVKSYERQDDSIKNWSFDSKDKWERGNVRKLSEGNCVGVVANI